MFDKLIESSQNPKETSLTVKALALGFVPVILFVTNKFGLQGVDQNFLTEAIDAITLLTQQVTALVATLGVIWGLLRKVVPAGK